MDPETEERVQGLAKLPPEQRAAAADDLIEELEQELENASSTPKADLSPADDPRSSADRADQ